MTWSIDNTTNGYLGDRPLNLCYASNSQKNQKIFGIYTAAEGKNPTIFPLPQQDPNKLPVINANGHVIAYINPQKMNSLALADNQTAEEKILEELNAPSRFSKAIGFIKNHYRPTVIALSAITLFALSYMVSRYGIFNNLFLPKETKAFFNWGKQHCPKMSAKDPYYKNCEVYRALCKK